MPREVILYIAMSLDGYIAKKDGDVGWLEGDGSDKNADIKYMEFYQNIDTVIMGKKTYDQILTFGEYPYKGTMGYVYTSKKIKKTEDVIFTNEDTITLIERLKRQQGKDIWLIGGAKLTDNFIKNNLIDKYYISIIPCILGKGIRLFENDNPLTKLKLDKCEVVNGISLLNYSKR